MVTLKRVVSVEWWQGERRGTVEEVEVVSAVKFYQELCCEKKSEKWDGRWKGDGRGCGSK